MPQKRTVLYRQAAAVQASAGGYRRHGSRGGVYTNVTLSYASVRTAYNALLNAAETSLSWASESDSAGLQLDSNPD